MMVFDAKNVEVIQAEYEKPCCTDQNTLTNPLTNPLTIVIAVGKLRQANAIASTWPESLYRFGNSDMSRAGDAAEEGDEVQVWHSRIQKT
jgi:hypothetical protein